MRIRLFVATLLVVAFAALAHEGVRFKRVELVIPKGDPAAGRQAFLDLSCTSCHRVAGDPELPAPVSANPGPELAREDQELAELVTSILSPSHDVDEEVAARSEGRLSPMGDFIDAMTVRQLVDLVAYLRTAAEEAAPAAPEPSPPGR
jgi:mono/diheme cytochrome c family protein